MSKSPMEMANNEYTLLPKLSTHMDVYLTNAISLRPSTEICDLVLRLNWPIAKQLRLPLQIVLNRNHSVNPYGLLLTANLLGTWGCILRFTVLKCYDWASLSDEADWSLDFARFWRTALSDSQQITTKETVYQSFRSNAIMAANVLPNFPSSAFAQQ